MVADASVRCNSCSVNRDRPMVSSPAARLPKRWLRHLLHPSWLAGIISIGVHGGLFAAGPNFTGLNFKAIADLELPEEQRQVPLIELTAAEQQRLPDFSKPFYSLENFGDLEQINPLIVGQDAATPAIGKTTTPPSPLRGGNRVGITAQPNKSSSSSSSSASRQDFPIGYSINPSVPLPDLSGNSPFSVTPPPPPSDTAAEAEETLNEAVDETPDVENSELEATGNGSEEPRAEDLQAETASAGEVESSQPNLVEFLAQGNSIADLPPEEQLAIFTTYDSALTTDAEEHERYEDWILGNKAANGNPKIEFFESAPLSLPSLEPQYCLQPEPQDGLIGAIVDTEGTLLGEPEILRSTGYVGFNLQAAQIIRAQAFGPTESVAVYQFPVIVEYDSENCEPIPEIKDTPAKENTDAPEIPEVSAPEIPGVGTPESSEAESSTNISADPEPTAEANGADTQEVESNTNVGVDSEPTAEVNGAETQETEPNSEQPLADTAEAAE